MSQIKRSFKLKPAEESESEQSKLYAFEPGDMTRYLVLITDMHERSIRQIVGGVTESYKLVTLVGGFSSQKSYPLNFDFNLSLDGNIGYIETKFSINNTEAKKLVEMLEYIQSYTIHDEDISNADKLSES